MKEFAPFIAGTTGQMKTNQWKSKVDCMMQNLTQWIQPNLDQLAAVDTGIDEESSLGNTSQPHQTTHDS
jgi:hypothetical protein